MSFRIDAFQNRYLAAGQSRVDAIVTVAAGDDAQAASGGQLVVGFIIDKSGSMADQRIESVKQAVGHAISMLDEHTWFFVVAFDETAQLIVAEAEANPEAKKAAKNALRYLTAGGGTAMSTGLRAARAVFERAPDAIRQAVFLTDGKNESEQPHTVAEELALCANVFQCDCWGVGTDWRVGEVQQIAQGLLGKASLIPDPSGMEAAFRAAIEKASNKALKDVRLRMWVPQGAAIAFVKQVNPTIEEMTDKAKVVTPQIREYATGAWAPGESRDFHVAIDVRVGKVGDEMLAGRPSLIYMQPAPGGSGWIEAEVKPAESRLFANWTADDSLASRIDNHVAHYTGQGELAQAIQEGLELREKGNELGATQMLGKAVKIAHKSQNIEMTQRLAKVVEVLDPASGTVRLKKDVKKAATMDLQLESHTTKRASKSGTPAKPPGGTPGTGTPPAPQGTP